MRSIRNRDPDVVIFLITNISDPNFISIAKELKVELVDVAKFETSLEKLKKLYVNETPNSTDFNIMTLGRWFVLARFCSEAHISKVMLIDHDCMLFSSVSSITARCSDFSLACVNECVPPYVVNSLEPLLCFTDNVLSAYAYPNNSIRRFTSQDDVPCEMTFFRSMIRLYSATAWPSSTGKRILPRPFSYLDLGALAKEYDERCPSSFVTCDPQLSRHEFNDSQSWETTESDYGTYGKKLTWVKGRPYGKIPSLGPAWTNIRFEMLHCWGPWKDKMKEIYARSTKSQLSLG